MQPEQDGARVLTVDDDDELLRIACPPHAKDKGSVDSHLGGSTPLSRTRRSSAA
jgi:hypothetical protein